MYKNSLNLFINLISFDQSLVKTHNEIDEITKSSDLCNKELETLAASLDTITQHVKELKMEVDAKELEMKMLDEKEKSGKKRLDSVTSDKEYQALKKEIEQSKQKQHDYEEVLVSVWADYESAQKELEAKKETYKKEKEEIDRVLTEKKERLDELSKIVKNHSEERTLKQEGIPEEWLTLYKRMSRAVSNPVVEVQQGSCTACFYKIPHQDLLTVQNAELLSCKGCYRLLYIKDEPVQEVETGE
jgi:uncharacterized protein